MEIKDYYCFKYWSVGISELATLGIMKLLESLRPTLCPNRAYNLVVEIRWAYLNQSGSSKSNLGLNDTFCITVNYIAIQQGRLKKRESLGKQKKEVKYV